ncbi:tlde1 domain-containing protein [Paraburkholderia caballeronis]|uniref:tlde1 domain-containing protein n=1 Tax=Paraburkholderia caballeronis TaxID=416943 RepID=UPI001066B6BE|nr:uncharacterized protein DUF2778 [Paraburkholderia caballeronis]TDV22101.1 uncharacterized protein DUF2778 [Paraburkholderia caballeronis]TDV29005.1 uncharacterized protein DUF2778 [Paraburkholderia caballeronis]
MAPILCTFDLNRRRTSRLQCSGIGSIDAFSGDQYGRGNPDAVAERNIGPIPEGTWYIVDRQSGGNFGYLYDWWSQRGFRTTNRTK